MTFPVHFDLLGQRVHPHLAMEIVAYALGFQLYRVMRKRRRVSDPAAVLPFEQNVWLIVGCIFGALVGSKVLAWVEAFDQYWPHRANPRVWLGGKTIVGGLLGGWVGVEITKWRLGIARSTGDLFVFPLILGMSLGRVGCFLTGLDDHTYGVATSLPWGVDFGDGVRRHPTQLYDIAALAAIALLCLIRMRWAWANGRMFRWFMLGYLAWRFGVEFIKPREIRLPWLNLSAIQLASLAGAGVCAALLVFRRRGATRHELSTVTGASHEAV